MTKPIIEPATGRMWASAGELAEELGCAVPTVRHHVNGHSPKTIFQRVFQYAAVGRGAPSKAATLKAHEWRYAVGKGTDGIPDRVLVHHGRRLIMDMQISKLAGVVALPAQYIPADGYQWRVMNPILNQWSPWQYGKVTWPGLALQPSSMLQERGLWVAGGAK